MIASPLKGSTPGSTPMLQVRDLGIRFGGVVALQDVTFDVHRGEILGLVGPNGAGKTSLFNCLNQIYIPQSGEILFEGVSHSGTRPADCVYRGIARTFQGVALFSKMTVLENVMVGAHRSLGSAVIPDLWKMPWMSKVESAARKLALDLISFLDLDLYAKRPVTGLPYGILKKVEIARALAAKPKLLLLDEPVGGLNQMEMNDIKDCLLRLKAMGEVTQIIVEHNMPLVMQICDRVIVLESGKVIADGLPDEVRRNPDVIAAYLGGAVP